MRWDELAERWSPPIGRRRKIRLTPAVLAWRAGHALVALGFLSSIAYVWWCALTGRRGRLLRPAVLALVGEGLLIAGNRGDCPLGGSASASATRSRCSSSSYPRRRRSARSQSSPASRARGSPSSPLALAADLAWAFAIDVESAGFVIFGGERYALAWNPDSGLRRWTPS